MDDYLLQKIYSYVEETYVLLETVRDFTINLEKNAFPIDFCQLIAFYDPEILEKEIIDNNVDFDQYDSLYDYCLLNFDVTTSEELKSKYPKSYYISHVKKITNKFVVIIEHHRYFKLNPNEECFRVGLRNEKKDFLIFSHQQKSGYTLRNIGDLIKSDLLSLFQRATEKQKNKLLKKQNIIGWEIYINSGIDGNMVIEVLMP